MDNININFKAIVKETLVIAGFMFILTNIISYIRKPVLSSDSIPKIEAQLIDGSRYRLKEGKPLVLHFWGIWCPACKLEASNIEHISKEYEVLTIAVNSGNDMKIKAFLKKRGLSFDVLNDEEGKWARKFKIEAYPTTFIYDGKGELRFTEVGYTTTAGLLARLKLIK